MSTQYSMNIVESNYRLTSIVINEVFITELMVIKRYDEQNIENHLVKSYVTIVQFDWQT